MPKVNYYAMTDAAIAQEIGQRLEQIRLEANIPQRMILEELGISKGSYRNALKGKAKFEVIIGILRILGKLENLDSFLPPAPFSPIELLKLEGKKRQRAGSKKTNKTSENGDLGW